MKKVEMTSGSLWKNILLFSLPLMMTQVLEVLFNLSDVAIAGKYAYNTYIALGAVGSTTTRAAHRHGRGRQRGRGPLAGHRR